MAPAKRTSLLASVLLCVSVTFLGSKCTAWVPAASRGQSGAAHSRAAVALRAEPEQQQKRVIVYVPDASPVGVQVVTAFNKLIGLKDEGEIKLVLEELSASQRTMLTTLLKAKDSTEITTTKPELGDTPERLFKKFQMLDDDDEIQAMRVNLGGDLMQAVQEIIEVYQTELADKDAEKKHEDEAEANVAWESFKRQFPVPVANGVYFTTPVRQNDIQYRFRRLKESLGIDSETAMRIADRDGSPFLVDPDCVRRTFKMMVSECGSKEDVLENVVLKHPGSLVASATGLKGQMNQMKMSAMFMDFTSGMNRFLRDNLSQNGRRTFINAREGGAAFGGGLPAWKRQWDKEAQEKRMNENAANKERVPIE